MSGSGVTNPSIVGEKIRIVNSSDPTKTGRRGEVVLETCKTILLESSDGRRIRMEKTGTVMLLEDSKRVVNGDDIAGRLEDRLGSRKR
jgi:ribonuclease P protein subunit POP4